MVIRRTWGDVADKNCALAIAAKPLQMETRLLLTAYRNSSSPYRTVPSSILYDVPFSHNICDTDNDRQTDDRRHIIVLARLELTVSQKPANV